MRLAHPHSSLTTTLTTPEENDIASEIETNETIIDVQ